MTKTEIQTFIEEMEAIDDKWTEEEVERCYGDVSLLEALNKRKLEVGQFFSGIGMAINYMVSKEDDEVD